MIYFYTYRDQSDLFSQVLEQTFAGFDNPSTEVRTVLDAEERATLVEYTDDVDEAAIEFWAVQDNHTGTEFEFAASLQGRCREVQCAMEVVQYSSTY